MTPKEIYNEWKKARTTKQCAEMATVDAYNEDEVAAGWHACLGGDILESVEQVKVWDEPVTLEGIDLYENSVVAICNKNKSKIKVSLDSIELIKPTKVQRLWIKAYLECNNIN
ncbi:MAG: hypothetical protein HQK51_16125 [Oligoflexia bacterium]|nr:hypothetical protein [Oligoflexia bacterium]